MPQLEPPELTLVKEIDNVTFRVTLQFYDAEGHAVGPCFSNRELAHEWYVRANAALYGRPERRATHIDRRWREKPTQTAEKRGASGRRHTDRAPELVDNVDKLRSQIKKILIDHTQNQAKQNENAQAEA